MWLIFSLILFFVYALVFGGSGLALAWITDHASRGAVTRWLPPRIWVVLTVAAIVALAAKVDPLARTGMASVFEYPFFVWWALACLCGDSGCRWRVLRNGARTSSRSRACQVVSRPRFCSTCTDRKPGTTRVYIVGSRGALEELGRAVQAALSEPSGVAATHVVFPSDGEGYRAVIVRVENVSYFTRLGLPYFGDIAGGTTPEGKVRMLLPDELLEAVRHASQAADERTG